MHVGGFEEPFELPDTRGVAHFAEGLGLDLADAFAGDLELPADLLERAAVAVHESEALFEDLTLALGEGREHVANLVLEQADGRDVRRIFGRAVGDEIAEARVVAVADGRLQRDGLLRHLQHRADAFDGEVDFLGDFLGRGLATKILQGAIPLVCFGVCDEGRR